MIKILFICHGNICRSPMAEYVFKDLVAREQLSEMFWVASAATSTEEIGNGMHHGTRKKLDEMKIPYGKHRARQITAKDYAEFDYIVCMDKANKRNLERLLGADKAQKVKLLLDYTVSPGDIADPWYTGDFETTYLDVLRGCEGLLAEIRGLN
jgi:protein-tyrosine phosphatase